ncbi:putative MFS-type transporter [Venturia nashicola]|nr:putative MFS-type transporter [Venturia nashicola]
MILPPAAHPHRPFKSLLQSHRLLQSNIASLRRSRFSYYRQFNSRSSLAEDRKRTVNQTPQSSASTPLPPSAASADHATEQSSNASLPPSWEDDPKWNISTFDELPHQKFGWNQHMHTNEEFKIALRQIVRQFRAPIRYAFAYGSGVFPQTSSNPAPLSLSPHPHPPDAIVKWQQGGGKMIDFIFGVSFTQHWHSLNLSEHRDHYSILGSLGSAFVSRVQDSWGAGVYFNPFVTVNGTLIKYGVVNLDTIRRDLSTWDTLYLAGRLQKPVKIIRDDPTIRLANQINLISAVRTALLMLGPEFTEMEMYTAIAGISYMGDPRIRFKTENPNKVANIVKNQLPYFRRLYTPLVEDLPNVSFNDSRCAADGWMQDPSCNYKLEQDMDPRKRGNMVRRLPEAFRAKLYFLYQGKFQIPRGEFDDMLEASKDEDETSFRRREGSNFDKRIAAEGDLDDMVGKAIKKTVEWPSVGQTLKGPFTAGLSRSWKYYSEKRAKSKEVKKERPTKDGVQKKD